MLEKRLDVAAATLATPLDQQDGGEAKGEEMVDIREAYDEALHGPLPSRGKGHPSSVQASSMG